jgi:hypothetical protein
LSRDGPFVRLVSDVRGNGAGAVPAGERFVELRPLLISIAYRMLGSVAEAEDVVQDGFLRWHRATTEGAEVDSEKSSQPPDAIANLPGYAGEYDGIRRFTALLPSLARVGVGRLAYPPAASGASRPRHGRKRARSCPPAPTTAAIATQLSASKPLSPKRKL